MLGNLFEIRINQPRIFGTNTAKTVDRIYYGGVTIPTIQLDNKKVVCGIPEQSSGWIQIEVTDKQSKFSI